MIANVEMAAAWDGDEGEHWAAHAERYEQISVRFQEPLLRTVRVDRDDSILDIGCGTGRSTRELARRAVAGTVFGADLSSRMLERARAAAQDEGLTNVRFEQADAQVYPFPDGAFDLAISVFGAMFFADPVAAFLNVRRSLGGQGRLALLAWRDLAVNEWITSIRAALAAGRTLPTPPPGAPGPFGFAERDHVERVLTAAGFVDVELDEVDKSMRIGVDADDAFSFVGSFGITRGLINDLDEAGKAAALATLKRTLVDHETDDGVVFRGAAWLITARAGTGTT